ncbi:MAG: Alkaline phosphatase [Verrucomicrobiaceae bacterium]|nr:Alkaline phosphatase [Verrucomicrobiaceae bacterium]
MRISPSRFFSLLAGVFVSLFGVAHAQQHSAARLWNEQNLAAIRINVPNPPAHARNLFHTAAAMYDAWAAYDPTAVGYIYNEKISPLPANVEAARAEAISYAAYRVLRNRYSSGAGAATTLTNLDNQLTSLGYSTTVAQAALTNDTTPAELGKRVGQAVLTYGASDGFSQTAFPQAYTAAVNPNVALPMSVLGNNGENPTRLNMPLGVGLPSGTSANFWQPLDLVTSVTQNGIPTPGGPQTFVGVQSLATAPFSLTRVDPTKPWLDPFGGPSKLSSPGSPSPTDAAYKANVLDVITRSALLNDPTLIDASPGTTGNNPLGTDSGTGYATNPITGQPYAANPVKRGDYVRVLAEFWADGPNSETPPGHWHVLANEVADDPLLVKKIGGTGAVVTDLEWDV